MASMSSIRKSVKAVLLTAALLLPLICACLALSASAAVLVTTVRYDGTMTTAYEPCSLCFQVGVLGAPEGADIQYMWQTTVGCLLSDGRWFDGAECNWSVPYNTDTLWVKASEGNSALEDGNRFVYRCRVTVNGTDYYSQNFWENTLPSSKYETINIIDLTVPAVGKDHVSAYGVTTAHLLPAGIDWFCERGSDKTYYKMGDYEKFAANNRYFANIYLEMDDGWAADFDKTKVTVNGVGARLLSVPKDSRTLRIIAEYYMDGTKCVPVAADPTVSEVLAFLESGMNPVVTDFTKPVDVYVTAGSDLHLSFPYRPLSASLEAKGYEIVESWEYRIGGNVDRESGEITGSFSLLNAKKTSGEQTLDVTLRLALNGKILYNCEKTLQYIIHVLPAEDAPVVYGSTQGTLTYKDGDTLVLRCRASGTDLKYQWMVYRQTKYGGYAWEAWYSPDGSLLSLKNLDSSFDGLLFKCRVSNKAGYDESAPVYLVREESGIGRVDAALTSLVSGSKLTDPSVRVLTEGVTAGETVAYYAPDVEKAVAAIPNGLPAFLATLEPASPGTDVVPGGTYFIVFTFGAHDPGFFEDGAVAYIDGTNIPVRERSSHEIVAVMRYDVDSDIGSYVKGDVNGDGEVDIIDYLSVKRHVLGTIVLKAAEQQRADVNGDGEIDVIDYTIVKRIALGIGMG